MDSIRILHTSDWHLGKVLHGYSLIEDQKFFLDHTLTQLINEKYDILLVAGDIYDRSTPQTEAVELFNSFITDLTDKTDVELYIIPGNHDSASRLAFATSILKRHRVHIVTDPNKVGTPIVYTKGDITLHTFMLPFLERFVYGVDYSESVTSCATHAVDLMRPALESGNGTKLLAGHFFATGGTTSDSERPCVGSLAAVDGSIFNAFDYVALGHLHAYQKSGSNGFYSGSPMSYSCSEAKHEHGYISIEVDNNGVHSDFVPFIPLRPIVTIEGTVIELLQSEIFKKDENSYVEVILNDDELVSAPATLLKNRFPYLLNIQQKAVAHRKQASSNYNKSMNLDDTFRSFYDYLYSEEPEDEVVTLFNAIVEEVEREA